jgi:hypothetical protein
MYGIPWLISYHLYYILYIYIYIYTYYVTIYAHLRCVSTSTVHVLYININIIYIMNGTSMFTHSWGRHPKNL